MSIEIIDSKPLNLKTKNKGKSMLAGDEKNFELREIAFWRKRFLHENFDLTPNPKDETLIWSFGAMSSKDFMELKDLNLWKNILNKKKEKS